ncbi:MAG: PilZ domain-containing protein [Deltaproteobacteria bacterium]|nr:PilZ domain-containing protein [Deltaproteobacteria bacterium]
MITRRVNRRAQRFGVRLPVKELNGRPARDIYVVDLSSLGARLETDSPLAPRNAVEFTVVLPHREAATRFSGQIVWARPLLHLPGRFHLGIRFFAPNWELDRLAREGKT